MAWKIELSSSAEKDLLKLDTQIARRILMFLRDRVAPLRDPRSIGEALKGSELGQYWKYRVAATTALLRILKIKHCACWWYASATARIFIKNNSNG